MRRARSSIGVLAFVSVLVGCATSPLGRKQLILLPESQMDQMGAQAFQEMKAKTPSSKDPVVTAYVNCVTLPLTEMAKSEIDEPKWEIVVFKDETANAFALPGGKVGVHTGILKVAKSPSQLAAVIGHEIGHVIARHGAERVSESLAAQGGLAIIDNFILGNSQGSQSHGLIMGALGLGAQFGVLLPHSRTQESEADLIGLDLMSRAGFDPRESVELWKNMSAASGKGAPPEFLSTHPAHETRIENLQSHLPESIPKFQKAKAAGFAPNCARP